MSGYGIEFEKELTSLINKYNIDSNLNTPDFILAAAMRRILPMLSSFVAERDHWWGFVPEIGNPHIASHGRSFPPLKNRFADLKTADKVFETLNYLMNDGGWTPEAIREFQNQAVKRIFELSV